MHVRSYPTLLYIIDCSTQSNNTVTQSIFPITFSNMVAGMLDEPLDRSFSKEILLNEQSWIF